MGVLSAESGFSCSHLVITNDSELFVDTIHTGLIGSRSIQNYVFEGWLSLETMKLKHILMTLIIKLTLGNIFIKVKNPPGGATITK